LNNGIRKRRGSLAKIQEEVDVSLAKKEKLEGRPLLDQGWKGKKSQNPEQQKEKSIMTLVLTLWILLRGTKNDYQRYK